jgi:hypothetical protein
MRSLSRAVDVSLDQNDMRQPLGNQSWILVTPKQAAMMGMRKIDIAGNRGGAARLSFAARSP